VKELERLAKSPIAAAAKRQQSEALRKRAEELIGQMSPQQREELKRWAQEAVKRNPELARGAQGGEGNPGPTPGAGERPGDPSSAGAGDGPQDAGGAASPARADASGHGPGPGAGPRGAGSPTGHVERETGGVRTEAVDARPPTPAERSARGNERVIAEWYGPGAKGSGGLTPEARRSVQEAVRGGERAIDDRAVAPRFDRLIERYFRRLPQRAQDGGASAPADGASAAPAKPAEPARDAP
jgi:hypothetical protein